jgi:hypothetical protein
MIIAAGNIMLSGTPEHEIAKICRMVSSAVLLQYDNCLTGGMLVFGRFGRTHRVRSSGK